MDSTSPSDTTKAPERPILDTALFALLAFMITWGTGMLIVLSSHANLVNGAHQVQHPIPLPFPIAITLVVIGGFGPFLAATAVTWLRSGRTGLRVLFRQFRRWRVHPVWFVTAFFGPAFLGLVALCVTALFGGATPAHWFTLPRPVLFACMVRRPLGRRVRVAGVRPTATAEASGGARRERGGWYHLVLMALLAGSDTCGRLAYGTFTSSLSHLAHV